MQTVLKNLHSVPGVIGCLLIDDEGNAIANSLPSIYDAASLKEISTIVAQNVEGLQDYTGNVVSLDMRFEHGRLIAKKMPKHVLVLLCQPTINIQLLLISLNVAINKLKPLVLMQKSAPNTSQPPVQEAPQAAPAAGTVRTNDKGIILTTRVLENTSDMSANSLIGPKTAAAISTFFHGLEYKILLLQNTKNGKSVKVPVKIISNDPNGNYDGIIGITPSIAGDLGAKNGDDLVITVSTSKGFFG